MRIDKYDPIDGGFRAPLAANYAGSANAIGVGLDANGRVVVGGEGTTGIIGVICNPSSNVPGATTKAGDPVDVMTDGEIVGFGGVAGTKYYANPTTGVISTSAAAGQVYVGHTVEADRLIVRVGRAMGAVT